MRVASVRIPAPVWTGVLAFFATLIVGGIWTALLAVNLMTTPAVPWAVVVMGLLLWLMWRYLGGRWGPSSTSAARHRLLRAAPLPRRIFAWALAAGVLSIIALMGLWIVLFQIAGLPPRALPDYSQYPLLTVALVLVMASLVSAVAEEAWFRGYFQGTLELTLAGPLAIVVASLLLAPGHALTQGFVWPTLLFYLFVDVMLGTIAYLTGSILPGLVVHALGLLAFFTLVWPGDVIRQWAGAGSRDTWFWIHVAQAIIFAALALLVFIRLAGLTRNLPRKPGTAESRKVPVA